MSIAAAQGRFDPIVDWLAAFFPAGCAAYAGWLLGPLVGYLPLAAALAAGGALYLAGFLFMRAMRPARPAFLLPELGCDLDRAADELVLETVWRDVADELDELLLDRPAFDAGSIALGELILEDALPPPPPDSRVVQLFAPQQLKERVDRHLANARAVQPSPAEEDPGASDDPLRLALADLKRSLRRA
jgi:hypothetical protein